MTSPAALENLSWFVIMCYRILTMLCSDVSCSRVSYSLTSFASYELNAPCAQSIRFRSFPFTLYLCFFPFSYNYFLFLSQEVGKCVLDDIAITREQVSII